jgi:Protein of unknown function (DUF2808)
MQQVGLGLTIAGIGLLLASSPSDLDFHRWSRVDRRPASDRVMSATDLVAVKKNACYLTVEVPEASEQGISKLSFAQQFPDQNTSPIQFDLAKTTAFVGTPAAMGSSVGSVNASLDETLTLWVDFDPSITPGTTLTLALKPERPLANDHYDFVITAYPDTEDPIPEFLGAVILSANDANTCQFLVAQESQSTDKTIP